MKPRILFQARVNLASASYPLANVPYDGVTTGAYTDLKVGMTIVFGTEAGAWDLGHTYVRGDLVQNVATSSNIQIGYCSRGRRPGEVDLIDNAYITVFDTYEMWKRQSRGGSAPGSILKDYELSVSNRFLPLIHCANTGGLGTMDFIDPDTGTLEVALDASGGVITDPLSSSYVYRAWDIGDGSYISGSSSATSIVASFPPGYRWVERFEIDNQLRVGLPRRYLVMALEEEGENAPNTTAYRVRWSRSIDGQTLTADLNERLDPDDYPPGTVVMLMVKSEYDQESGSARADGFTMAFAGWLDFQRGSGRANLYQTERGTTLQAVDVGGRLKQLRGFPSRMERVTGFPANANQMTEATLWRYVWWELVWHTFAPMFSDVDLQIDAGDEFPFSLFYNSGGSFYAICDALAKAQGYRFTCDSLGVLRLVVDPMRQEQADRTSEVQAEILETDWSSIDRLTNARPPVAVMRGTSLLTSTTPSADLVAAQEELYAIAPGIVEGAGAGEEALGYPSLSDTEPTFWGRLGQDYARRNNPEDPLRLNLAHGGDVGIEPARMKWVEVTAAEENVGWMDRALEAERCLPLQVDFELDDESGTLTQSIVVETETVGTPAVREPRPVVVSRPTIREPNLSPVPSSDWLLSAAAGNIFSIDHNGYLYYTDTFGRRAADGGPTYGRIALSLTGTVCDWVTDPFCPLYRTGSGVVSGWIATTERIYGFSFNPLTLSATVTSQKTLPTTSEGLRRIETERGVQNFVAVVSSYVGTGTAVCVTTDGSTWGSEVTINADGAPYWAPGLYVSGKTAGKIITSTTTSTVAANNGKVSLNSGASFSTSTSPNLDHTGNGAFSIHLPWHDNDAEARAWYGFTNIPLVGSGVKRIYRVNGAIQTDVSPEDSGETFGAQTQKAIDTSPLNRRKVYACLRNGVDNASAASDDMWVFVSSDEGATWTDIPELAGVISTGVYAAVRCAGDNEDVAYAIGNNGRIAYIEGDEADDRSGNLGTFSSPSVGTFRNLAGW